MCYPQSLWVNDLGELPLESVAKQVQAHEGCHRLVSERRSERGQTDSHLVRVCEVCELAQVRNLG